MSRQAVGRGRRKWSVLVLSALAPAALIFGGGGDADPSADAASSALLATQAPAADEQHAPRGVEVVPTPAAVPDGSRTIVEASAVVSPMSQMSAASRWR
ncbi:MAG: hypothetical protein K0U84_13950, partial [Actinomycetia bacterium]|nr:hypothetical protein [Actinomycetes bacterium]